MSLERAKDLVDIFNNGDFDDDIEPYFNDLITFFKFVKKYGLLDELDLGQVGYRDWNDELIEFLDEKNVPKRKLSLKWFQRSVDSPLGLPFNIASYAILLHLLAKEVNMIPHQLKFNGGDCHIYLNQIDGVKEQLTRETYNLPKIKLHNNSIFDFKYEDIEIVNYDERIKTIKFPLSN
jgi:thymidylate synthase